MIYLGHHFPEKGVFWANTETGGGMDTTSVARCLWLAKRFSVRFTGTVTGIPFDISSSVGTGVTENTFTERFEAFASGGGAGVWLPIVMEGPMTQGRVYLYATVRFGSDIWPEFSPILYRRFEDVWEIPIYVSISHSLLSEEGSTESPTPVGTAGGTTQNPWLFGDEQVGAAFFGSEQPGGQWSTGVLLRGGTGISSLIESSVSFTVDEYCALA